MSAKIGSFHIMSVLGLTEIHEISCKYNKKVHKQLDKEMKDMVTTKSVIKLTDYKLAYFIS